MVGVNRRSRNDHKQKQKPKQNQNQDQDQDLNHNQYRHELAKTNLDFNTALQEVDVVGGKEITFVLLTVTISIILTTVIGVAAGMTISIHYFTENQNPPVMQPRTSPRDGPLLYSRPALYQKITTLDPIIASSYMVQRTEKNLAKVVTASPTGQLNVLMVVDEMAPLRSNFKSSNIQSNNSDHTSTGYTLNTAHYFDGSKKELTEEQTEEISPGYQQWESSQPKIELRQPIIHPSKCSDGVTIGFDNWALLRRAVQEANSISAERFMKWNEYFATNSFAAFQDDQLYYEEDVVFSICPGTVLRARNGPIFINAENVVLECKEKCVVDVGGTHIQFGANAKNILVRGITFRRASATSLTFFHDGADVSFEDCSWISEYGINNYIGSVANVNSTSIINFYRCHIGLGGKTIAMGTSSATTNSLSIRV